MSGSKTLGIGMTTARRSAWWLELRQISAAKNVRLFWTKYAQYLEEENIISGDRRALHNIILETISELGPSAVESQKTA